MQVNELVDSGINSPTTNQVLHAVEDITRIRTDSEHWLAQNKHMGLSVCLER